MADEELDNESVRQSKKKKRLILILIAAVILIVGGIVAFVVLGQQVTSLILDENGQSDSADLSNDYLRMDEMLITIKSGDSRQQYLKFRYAFELNNVGDSLVILGVLPRIIDDYQAFLRELRVEELQGSEGWYRLKEELLIRANTILAPLRIKEVLISELVIQ